MTEQYLLTQSFYLPADVISRMGLIENMERLRLIRTAEQLKPSYLAINFNNIARLNSKAQSALVLNYCRRSLRSTKQEQSAIRRLRNAPSTAIRNSSRGFALFRSKARLSTDRM